MKKKRLILITFGILLLIPTLAFADCLDLGGFSSWVLENTHTIVFYMETRPVARLEIPYLRWIRHPIFVSSKVTCVIRTIL